MASFPLKNAHFSYPLRSTPKLKTFPLNCIPQILYRANRDTGLNNRAKFSPKIYPLGYIRYMQDIQTDGNVVVVVVAHSSSPSLVVWIVP